MGGREVQTERGYKGTLGGNESILYLNYSSGYTHTYLSNGYNFTECKLYSIKSIKKQLGLLDIILAKQNKHSTNIISIPNTLKNFGEGAGGQRWNQAKTAVRAPYGEIGGVTDACLRVLPDHWQRQLPLTLPVSPL